MERSVAASRDYTMGDAVSQQNGECSRFDTASPATILAWAVFD
jgi:hypothetical protein